MQQLPRRETDAQVTSALIV